MKKEIDKLFIIGIIFGFLFLVFSVNFAAGSFQLSTCNESTSVAQVYGPSENIRGWANLSFEDEFTDSLISSNLGGSIKLIDFLNENLADYDCAPADCTDDYVSSNGQDSKSFYLNYGEEEIITFFIDKGTISSVKELKFNVSVSNNPSCINPLKIDILNDGSVEWKSKSFLADYSCTYEGGMGCFDSGASLENVTIDDTPFCGKINLVESSDFSLGAWVKKGITPWYNGLLEMRLYDLNGYSLESCDLPEPSTEGGEISCIIEYDNDGVQEYYVCIKAYNGASTDYEIKKEDVSPCGFYAIPGDETEYHDYYIFAKSAKFDNLGEFTFDKQEYEDQGNSDLGQYILDYLDVRYGKDCSGGCSIPIKFESYGGLNIVVSDAGLDYSTGGGSQVPLTKIYDTSTEKAKINSGFQKLDLEKAGLPAPSSIGTYILILKLNDEMILEQDIRVVSIAEISDIIPHDVPALVSVKFRVLLNETGNMSYNWDFGDGTEKTSDTNIIEHTYSSLGTYQLSVSVKNQFGNSSKTVQITAGAPKEYINKTIQNYNSKLGGVQAEINKLPEWIKKSVDSKIDIDDLKSQIEVQNGKYKEAFLDDDYIKIMTSLLELDIPGSFGESQSFSSSQIFPAQGQINLNALDYFGAGSIEGSEENYANAITNWISGNLDVVLKSKTYSLYYNGEEDPIYSYIKVTLTPKQDLGGVYFLINENSDEVKFKEDYKAREYRAKTAGVLTKLIGKVISFRAVESLFEDMGALGVVFSELTGPQTMEFLYPGKVDVNNFPIYVSPEFKDLELGAEVGICNFNKRCEKDLGENYKNCRNDCKPLGWTLFWFFLLLSAGFVAYIILQEWYKRYYEGHLFKDKNQLFNLINFMNNSFNQGIGRLKIFGKLKDLDWDREQLGYAWNKLHGKRTGMWEIPIFKWVEKKQVKEELEKRRGGGLVGP